DDLCFHTHGVPRPLHSFPTRRSSDLIGVNATRIAADSASTVSAYRQLEAHEFRAKGVYGRLGDAIERLLHATAVGKLPEKFLGREIPSHLQEAFSAGVVRINLKFRRSGSRLSANLTIASPPGSTPAVDG